MTEPTPAELRAAVLAHMRAMGAKGGRKGGKVRASRLTAEERSESARRAVQARWAMAKKKPTIKKPSLGTR